MCVCVSHKCNHILITEVDPGRHGDDPVTNESMMEGGVVGGDPALPMMAPQGLVEEAENGNLWHFYKYF